MNFKKIILVVLISLVCLQGVLSVPMLLDQQGILRNSTNNNLINGTYEFNTSFYNLSDDTLVYTETRNISIVNGVWNNHIGLISPLSISNFNYNTYIITKIGTETLSRINVTSVPYAIQSLQSNNSDYLGGIISTNYTKLNDNVYFGNVNITKNLSVSQYIDGQPLDGMLGSAIIWANGTNTYAEIIINCTGLNCSYNAFKVRLVNTSNNIKYCDIPAGNYTFTDNQHSVLIVNNTCGVQEVSIQTYITTSLSPGGITDFANVIMEGGNPYDTNGLEIENKRMIKLRKLLLRTMHLDIVSGFTKQQNSVFPQFNITSGEYVYLMDTVSTTLQNTATDNIEVIYHTGALTWGSNDYTGLNITTCDTGSSIATCTNTGKYRRVFIFMLGYNDTADETQLHQLLPSQTIYYNTVAECLDTVTYPLTYTLPTFYQYGAVMLYAYCVRPSDTSWTNNWIDLRTVKQSTATGGLDTSIFLSHNSTEWIGDGYNLTFTSGNGLNASYILNPPWVNNNSNVTFDRINVSRAYVYGNITLINSSGTEETFYWDNAGGRFRVTDGFYADDIEASSFIKSGGDIYSDGAGDDSWLGTNIQAYSNMSMNSSGYVYANQSVYTPLLSLKTINLFEKSTSDLTINLNSTTNISFSDWTYGVDINCDGQSGDLCRFTTDPLIDTSKNFRFGASSNAYINFVTTGDDALRIQLYGQNHHLMITDRDISPTPTGVFLNPTLDIVANSTEIGDYVRIYHNDSMGFLESGNGSLTINADGNVSINTTINIAGNVSATKYFYTNGTELVNGGGADGNNYTVGIVVTGTTTKTLSLNRSGMSTNLTATWTDIDTDTYNSTSDMQTAVNNSGYFNISINASNVQNVPWFSNLSNFTQNLTTNKICIYNSTVGKIQCDYTDQVGAGSFVYSDYFDQNLNTTNNVKFNNINISDAGTGSSNVIVAGTSDGQGLLFEHLDDEDIKFSTRLTLYDTANSNGNLVLSTLMTGSYFPYIIKTTDWSNVTITKSQVTDFGTYQTGDELNNYTIGGAVTGTNSKTLSLNRSGMSTNLSITWTDLDTNDTTTVGLMYTNVTNLQTFQGLIYTNVTDLQTFQGLIYTNVTNANLTAAAALPKAGGTMTGNITMTNNSITALKCIVFDNNATIGNCG